MTDLEIAKKYKIKDISIIANELGLKEEDIELYGKYKAKILNKSNNKNGKLILVTSTSPTPYGEGKTTMSIGLCDAINKIGYKSIVALREPSLGPVFGIKGGATGGGYAQVVPMEDINLHFTGDIHAITSANNLLCAAIDNHIFQGNSLNIDPNNITFNRCLDINDRALRKVYVGNTEKEVQRPDNFSISVASELMAILCLSEDLEDMKNRISKIIIGYTFDNKPVYVKDLNITGALTLLLKDAINPNLVQTIEGNPAIIHGGPFANIAHGCNSIIATKTALSLSDYVVTEAGFGSDLGGLKFLDIKCRYNNIKPDCVVINTTIRSIKHNGNCAKEDLSTLDLSYIENGICNLQAHIDIIKKYTNNIIVCLNKFYTDYEEEIEFVKQYLANLNIPFEISTAFSEGGNGSIDLAHKVIDICNNKYELNPLYDLEESIENKINIICKNIFKASEVTISEDIINKINNIKNIGCNNLPICIAKTQYSISDDPKKLGYPKDNIITIKDIKVCNGAGFIVVYLGKIMTMPGLSKEPAYINMDIDNNKNIVGLF